MKSEFDKEKSLHILLYMANKLGTEDFKKIFLILYYAEQKHLVKYGRTITKDRYFALPYGAVPTVIYNILKELRGV